MPHANELCVRKSWASRKDSKFDPDNAALHDDVAMLHAEAGHLDRTSDHFAQTVRVRPESAAAQYNLGNALFRQGRRAEAVEHLKRALALDPDYALAHDGLGVALYRRGNSVRRQDTDVPSNWIHAMPTRVLTWPSRFDGYLRSIQPWRSSRTS